MRISTVYSEMAISRSSPGLLVGTLWPWQPTTSQCQSIMRSQSRPSTSIWVMSSLWFYHRLSVQLLMILTPRVTRMLRLSRTQRPTSTSSKTIQTRIGFAEIWPIWSQSPPTLNKVAWSKTGRHPGHTTLTHRILMYLEYYTKYCEKVSLRFPGKGARALSWLSVRLFWQIVGINACQVGAPLISQRRSR